jgi:hypothetical protein
LFTNLTQQAVTIPAGTVIRTAGEEPGRFVTTRAGEVLAGVGEMLEVPIEAVDRGLAGNVDQETVVVVEGRLGLSVSVTNPEPLTGGREVPSVQASEADRRRAKNQLMRNLEEQARVRLAEEMNAGDILFESTFEVAQVLAEEYDPPAGAASTRLTLTMQVEYSALYTSDADLKQLASLALNASIPPGFGAESQALSIRPVTEPITNADGNTRWTVRAERRIVRQISSAQVMYMIQGLRSSRARELLEDNLPLDGAPEIQLSPAWWPWVPIAPFRISVATQENE